MEKNQNEVESEIGSSSAETTKPEQRKNPLGAIRKETLAIKRVVKKWPEFDISKLEAKLEKDRESFSKLSVRVSKQEDKDTGDGLELPKIEEKIKEEIREKEEVKEEEKLKEKPIEEKSPIDRVREIKPDLKELKEGPKFEAPEIPKTKVPPQLEGIDRFKIEFPESIKTTLKGVDKAAGSAVKGLGKTLTNVSRVFAGLELAQDIFVKHDARGATKHALQWGAAEAAAGLDIVGSVVGAPETLGGSLAGLAAAGAVGTGAYVGTGALFNRLFPEKKPKMAMGGIVTKPTMAIIGEGGEKEYIVPESKLSGFIQSHSKDDFKKPARIILGVTHNFISQFGKGSDDITRMVGPEILRLERIYGADTFTIPVFAKGENNFDNIIPSGLFDFLRGGEVKSGISSELVDSIDNLMSSLDSFLSDVEKISDGGGGDNAGGGGDGGGVITSSSKGDVNDNEIYSYLTKEKKLDDAHAKGILANISRESGFRVGIIGDNGSSGGLFQWHNDRFTLMRKNVPNWKTNWKGQVDYALLEDYGPKYIKNSYSSAKQASDDWLIKWERPADVFGDIKINDSYLESTGNKITKSESSTTLASTPPSTLTPMGETTKGLISGYEVTQEWHKKNNRDKGGHPGVDIGTNVGTSIALQVESQVIALDANAGNPSGYGKYLSVWVPSLNKQFLFGHLSAIGVKEGQTIPAGTVMAKTGQTGNVTGPHLHFEVHSEKYYEGSAKNENPAPFWKNLILGKGGSFTATSTTSSDDISSDKLSPKSSNAIMSRATKARSVLRYQSIDTAPFYGRRQTFIVKPIIFQSPPAPSPSPQTQPQNNKPKPKSKPTAQGFSPLVTPQQLD
jgi:murein DD-endopeptidase MepM/ murein hydrolase activator NlpD